MGNLHYGSPPASFDMPDRTLAHVEFVVLAKLRRKESFALSIESPTGGRQQIWINGAATLRFEFDTNVTDINRAWLEVLIDSANSAGGMRLTPEPERAG
ncbi:hypothetical protein [Agromyces salentinus]|uniref:DUF7882 domain-containing protein n=1 Tax=Agromyces salentinus TaxID=269421 RepID=A0ABN2MUV7_9MICO|nr:hypothetical protein [Agromyces salentinus]